MAKHLLGAMPTTWLLIRELRAIGDVLELLGGLADDGALMLEHPLAPGELAIAEDLRRLFGRSILLFILDGVVGIEGLPHRVMIGLPLHLLVMLLVLVLMLMVFVLVQVSAEVAAKVAEVLGLGANARLVLVEHRSLAVLDVLLVEVAALQEYRAGARAGH